jgi:hypothetical protein
MNVMNAANAFWSTVQDSMPSVQNRELKGVLSLDDFILDLANFVATCALNSFLLLFNFLCRLFAHFDVCE